MSNQLLKTPTTNETDAIASRRSFLTRVAYGSLLAMGCSGIAEAAAKHVIKSSTPKKSATKPATKEVKHATKPVKNSLHERLALKTENSRHSKTDNSKHKELASNSHGRVHSSLDRDHKGGHHLHNDNARERLLASHDKHPRVQHSLHKDYHHEEMPEFAFQDEQEIDAPRIHIEDVRKRFDLQRNNIAQNRFPFSNSRGNNVAHKALSLENTTTGDSLNVTYFERGRYLPDALHEINFLYRDHLTDEIHPVDVALLDQLHDLQATLGVTKRQISVICGYRSPFTNAQLRRNSRGVARHSLHMEGRAIDIRIAGVESRNVRDAALSMARGGVGYYPGSNFVHLDTGDFRTW
jgi:uncharacterized protein YcbK (DUF882 family)